MTSKRDKEMWSQKRKLKDHGWEAYQADRYNSGSETLAHSLSKAIVGHYLAHEHGYNVCFEVSHEDRGDVDVLAWSENDIICVECETNPQDDVISDKLDRYVKNGSPIREMFTVDPLEMPAEWMEAYKWVDQKLFQSLNE